jgi:small GTP-binding protein
MRTISKKVCLLGDFAVGKTSLVRRFVYNLFDDRYLSTIGVKVSRKMVIIPRDAEMIQLAMMLWDLGGSEEFMQMRGSYLRSTSGAVWVCDLTRPETLDSLPDYTGTLFEVSPGAQLVLAANKRDLVDEQRITVAQIEAVAKDLGTPYYLTSAKNGDQVEALFHQLARLLVA